MGFTIKIINYYRLHDGPIVSDEDILVEGVLLEGDAPHPGINALLIGQDGYKEQVFIKGVDFHLELPMVALLISGSKKKEKLKGSIMIIPEI
jgi:hypothetical protein